jgi:hypothetical protein
MLRIRTRRVALPMVAAGICAALVVGGGTAYAVTAATGGGQPSSPTVYACVTSTGQLEWLEVSTPGHKCAGQLHLWHWGDREDWPAGTSRAARTGWLLQQPVQRGGQRSRVHGVAEPQSG